jgi:periplasmic protein TonB
MELFGSATQLSQSQPWLNTRFGTPRLMSVGIHILLVGLALIPWTSALPLHPSLNETAVLLYTPSEFLSKSLILPGHAGGGGGGGKHQLTPASRGDLPRAAEKQFVPPDPEPPKNPALIVEPTVVAPQLAQVRSMTLLNIGDPNGVVGPPSSGVGDGGGIGDGKGHGVGEGNGPGVGPGDNGGSGGGSRGGGSGGMTAPTLIYRVDPEYSEEARKARFQGTVILETLVRKDGFVDLIHVVRSLGFGLDQNAIDAVKKWKFRPGMKNGAPVDVPMRIEVSFNLR